MNLQTLLHDYLPVYTARYGSVNTPAQWSALHAMLGCRRTAHYGFFSLHCTQCDWQGHHPLSCGHRACPQCHQHGHALWSERQCLKLLPVPYFLLTFTLPKQLHHLARAHQRQVYTRLFEAAIDTLRQFGRNDTHLAAELAATAMLHTHTRRIDYHPHVHLVVPKGFRRVSDYGFLHGNAKRRLQRLQYLLRIVIAPPKPREKVRITCPCCQAEVQITGIFRPSQNVLLQPG